MPRMKIIPMVARKGLLFGLIWHSARKRLYLFPLPCLGLRIDFDPTGVAQAERATKEVQEIGRLVKALTLEEGDTVELTCDRVDFAPGEPNSVVVCCGEWTDWKEQRFTDSTVVNALLLALHVRELRQAQRFRSGIDTMRGHKPTDDYVCDGWCGRSYKIADLHPASGQTYLCDECLQRVLDSGAKQ